MKRNILIIDDDQSTCDMLAEGLTGRGFDCVSFTSPEQAFSKILDQPFDAVLTDMQMPGMSGIDLCKRISQNRQDLPVIVITAFGSMESAISAIRAGAYDFVTKPFDMEMLALTVERAVRHHSLTSRVRLLSEALEEASHMDDLIGACPSMHALFSRARQVARTDSSVLITGETGTGKELLARAIHTHSTRNSGPFVAVSCPALPDSLLESELFGHAQGAFTDARKERTGLFLQANGGTIFLDEIGDLPAGLQAKLLRALEEHTIRPVGSDREIPFDARIIAATNRDLPAAVVEQRFREDLYFRINVVGLEIPPLRARGGDVLLIGQHFIERFAAAANKNTTGMSAAVAEKLSAYTWPGNVRELRNVIERGIAFTRHETLIVEDLPSEIRNYQASHVIITSGNPEELIPLDQVERRYILHVLEAAGQNRTQAARILGLDRKTLYRKLKGFGINTDS